jgi:hypothetical protein
MVVDQVDVCVERELAEWWPSQRCTCTTFLPSANGREATVWRNVWPLPHLFGAIALASAAHLRERCFDLAANYEARCSNASTTTVSAKIASTVAIDGCAPHQGMVPGYAFRNSAGRFGISTISIGSPSLSRRPSSCPLSHTFRFNTTVARPAALTSNQNRDRRPDVLPQSTSTSTTRPVRPPPNTTRSRSIPVKFSCPPIMVSFARRNDRLIRPITPRARTSKECSRASRPQQHLRSLADYSEAFCEGAGRALHRIPPQVLCFHRYRSSTAAWFSVLICSTVILARL